MYNLYCIREIETMKHQLTEAVWPLFSRVGYGVQRQSVRSMQVTS